MKISLIRCHSEFGPPGADLDPRGSISASGFGPAFEKPGPGQRRTIVYLPRKYEETFPPFTRWSKWRERVNRTKRYTSVGKENRNHFESELELGTLPWRWVKQLSCQTSTVICLRGNIQVHRYSSTLHHFTDAQIEEGILEIEREKFQSLNDDDIITIDGIIIIDNCTQGWSVKDQRGALNKMRV